MKQGFSITPVRVMRIIWIVCVLLLAVLWYWRPVEGFQAPAPATQSQQSQPQWAQFDVEDPMRPSDWSGLRDYFHYQRSPLDKPGMILMDPGIFQGPTPVRKEDIDKATKTIGYEFDPSSAANGISKFINTAEADTQTMGEQCKNATRPEQLKGLKEFMVDRARNGRGCGWWYVDNLYQPSTGAYGTAPTIDAYGKQTAAGGPTDPSIPKQYPGGEWIWDLDVAEKKEHIKRCKRVQNCDLIDGVDGCAFCPSKGYAVPVDGAGLKYPNDDEATCGDLGSLVSQGSRCPPMVIQPRLTNYDYDYDINGNVIVGPNSSALAQVGQTLEFICTGTTLSKACRLAMCKELAGCAEGKGLHRIVQQNGVLTETDRLALQYLANRGSLGIPETFTKTGTMDKAAAMDMMSRIRSMAMSSQSGIAKAAARWLIDETPFDVCLYGDADTGPFPTECLQREFRKAGCQASGSRYPTNANAFSGMSFGTIKTQFRDLFTQMTDTDQMTNVRDQDNAVRQCLGIGMVRDANETWAKNPNLCRDPGIEYFVYSIPKVGQVVLLGRLVVPELLQDSETPTADTQTLKALLKSATGFRGFSARTYVDIGASPTTVSLTLPTDALNDNYSIYINGAKVSQLTRIPLVQQQRNLIEVRFEIPQGSAFGAPTLTITPTSRLVLNQSAWKPFVALEPQTGRTLFSDTNQYLDVQSTEVVSMGIRRALDIPQRPLPFQLTTGIAYQTMKTITCMFYWKSLAGQSTVFQFDQGGGGIADTVLGFRIVDKFPTFILQSSKGLYKFQSPSALGNPNEWVHVAIVLGTADTIQVWINGTQIKDTLRKEAFGGAGSLYTRLVFGSPGFDGGIGWLHVYDRRLTVAEIARDRRYDDMRLSDKDVEVDVAGPIASPVAV